MPFPNEHACRVRDPGEFERFSRDNDKNPNVILGFRKDGSSDVQSYRYPKDTWSVDDAQAHCSEHEGSFEAAGESDSTRERRAFLTELRLEPRSDKSLPKIIGHAAVFESLSEDLGGWRELIRPGAFSAVLESDPDVRALVDHNPSKILGRTKSRTLKLAEDATGLRVEIMPANTTTGRDIVESIRRGDVDAMSFAMSSVEAEWRTDNEEAIREVTSVGRLWDVSPVSYPAYSETDVGVAKRDLDAFKAQRRWEEDPETVKRIKMAEAAEKELTEQDQEP